MDKKDTAGWVDGKGGEERDLVAVQAKGAAPEEVQAAPEVPSES